jgi:hypothetical protein
MRAHEFILEADDHYVYHGGTYSGNEGDYDSNIRGEPSSTRPLGVGLYAAGSEKHAGLYVQYRSGAKIHKFKVSPTAKLYPWGNDTWQTLSDDEKTYWRNQSRNIQDEFIKRGILKSKNMHWTDAISSSGYIRDRDSVRKLLVSLGIDGSYTQLPNDLIEYAFYNPAVLTPSETKHEST